MKFGKYTNDKFSKKNIYAEIERKHPHLLYEGCTKDYEDFADYLPAGKIVRGTIVA